MAGYARDRQCAADRCLGKGGFQSCGELDLDVVTVDARRIGAVNDTGVDLLLAGARVELPAVPGAGDNAPVERSLAQWPTLVGANTIEGLELTVDVKNRQHGILYDDFARLTRW